MGVRYKKVIFEGSTLAADGKVFIGNEDGEVVILKHGREMKELGIVEFSALFMQVSYC